MAKLVSAALAVLVLTACGGTLPPPKRRVVEGDVGGWHFRRYQKTVDIEVFIEGNGAGAHTASYADVQAEKAGRLREGDVVSVFVTEYQKKKGVNAALVKFARRLAQEAGYVVEEEKIGGQQVFRVVGHGEAWAFWASGKYVVKVGGRGVEKIPAALVEHYGKYYPSQVKDGALDEPLEAEPEPVKKVEKAKRGDGGGEEEGEE